MARSDLPPLGPPPEDLPRRELVVAKWTAPLYRVHRRDRDPLFFGKTGLSRFDDPRQEFGVLYASADLDGAFSETFAGISSITVTELSVRAWSAIEAARELRLCDLRQHELARIGADGRLCTGSRLHAQVWSRALWSHPSAVDGICYPARTNLSQVSVAIFDRAQPCISAATRNAFLNPEQQSRTAALLERYRIALIPD